jgi:hypothetical protein
MRSAHAIGGGDDAKDRNGKASDDCAVAHAGSTRMSSDKPRGGRFALLREVLVFQLKLLVCTGRDLVLLPTSMAAAAIDFVFKTRLFRTALVLGRWSDHWIKLWPEAANEDGSRAFDADALLAQIEGLVRDPKSGAEKARMLSRWARMQLARGRGEDGPGPKAP